jgi:hypothetical protein
MNNHLDTMLAQHRELRELADRYLAELASPTPDIAALGKCRWTLARLVSGHLAYEASHLYPTLQRLGAQAEASGRRAASEIGQMTDALGRHVRDWTAESIQKDWAGYRQSSKALVAMLCARMDKEEADLYPLVRQAKAA